MWTCCGHDAELDCFYNNCSAVEGCREYHYTCSTKRYCQNCGDASNPSYRHDERITHTLCGENIQLCTLP